MAELDNRFARLAGQARAGSMAARGRLERELEPCLMHIARRAIAQRALAQPCSPLHRRVLALTRRLEAADHPTTEPIAQALSHWVVGRVLPGETAGWDPMSTRADR